MASTRWTRWTGWNWTRLAHLWESFLVRWFRSFPAFFGVFVPFRFCSYSWLAKWLFTYILIFLFYIFYQRKFRSSNFRLYWKLPVGLAASMFDSRDVLAGRNCAKCCFSIVLSLRKLAKVGPKNGSCEGSAVQDAYKSCTTPARESDLEVKILKNWHAGSTFGSWHRQNLHHACAWERFGSPNR